MKKNKDDIKINENEMQNKKNEDDIKIYQPKVTDVNKDKNKKTNFIKSLYLYIIVFFSCFIILILIAYVGQIKQSRSVIADKEENIRVTQSLKKNVQDENVELKKELSQAKEKIATLETNTQQITSEFENLKKQADNLKLLSRGIYEYYNKNNSVKMNTKNAREILIKINPAYLSAENLEEYKYFKKKLDIPDATPETNTNEENQEAPPVTSEKK